MCVCICLFCVFFHLSFATHASSLFAAAAITTSTGCANQCEVLERGGREIRLWQSDRGDKLEVHPGGEAMYYELDGDDDTDDGMV